VRSSESARRSAVQQLPVSTSKNTAKGDRSRDKVIRTAIGERPCGLPSVKDCAAVVEPIRKKGQYRWAEAVRSRLIALCKRGMELGWMDSNPAEVTGTRTVSVKRGRLALEQFNAILAKADHWLPQAMLLAIVTGQGRSTISAMKRTDVKDGRLIVQRPKTQKTNRPVAIPLALRLNVLDQQQLRDPPHSAVRRRAGR
jgi:hypothetical protein